MFWSFDIRISDLVVLKMHQFDQIAFYFDVFLEAPKGELTKSDVSVKFATGYHH